MNASLETSFKKGFKLTEENLIKLDDIIRKRLTIPGAPPILKFKVYRVDGMLLEFNNPRGVTAEENSSRNAIKRVEVESQATAYKMSLRFDPKDNTALAIESNDRDLAYLLFSDIKEYLNSEVCKFRSFTFDAVFSSKNIFPFLMLPLMLFSLFSIKDAPSSETADRVLRETDLAAKLNFLIETRITSQDTSSLKYYLFAMFAMLLGIFFLGSVLDKLFPRNVFYWGKAAQSFDKILSVREKIIWGVVIAFVISIASALAYDQIKLPWGKAVHTTQERKS